MRGLLQVADVTAAGHSFLMSLAWRFDLVKEGPHDFVVTVGAPAPRQSFGPIRVVWWEGGGAAPDAELVFSPHPHPGVTHFPAPGVDAAHHSHVLPFVRRRAAVARGLDPHQGVDLWDGGHSDRLDVAPWVTTRDPATAAVALASGCPLITNGSLARELGLASGVTCQIARTRTGALEAGLGIGSDPALSAALSTRGRRHALERLNQAPALDELGHLLRGTGQPSLLIRELAHLGSLPDSPAVGQAARGYRGLVTEGEGNERRSV